MKMHKIALIFVILLWGQIAMGAINRVANSPYPSSLQPSSSTITVLFDSNYNNNELLTIQSIQGQIAKTQPQIYHVSNSGMQLWLNDLIANYSYTQNNTLSSSSISQIIENYYSYGWLSKGYIICDNSTINIALSLSAIEEGTFVIISDLLDVVQSLGIPLFFDARSKTTRWLWDNYSENFNKDIVVFQEQSKSMVALADYAVFASSIAFNDSFDEVVSNQIFHSMNSQAALLGWGNSEQGLVSRSSVASIMVNAADWAVDLSFLTNINLPSSFFPLQQKNSNDPFTSQNNINDDNNNIKDNIEKMKREEGEEHHTVCFVMTDGDNIQWILNSFGVSSEWWGSEYRGYVPITWTISPALIDLAPSVLSYLYRTATSPSNSSYVNLFNHEEEDVNKINVKEKRIIPGKGKGSDYFIASPSGLGYVYPDRYSDLSSFANLTSEYMKNADLSILNVISDGPPSSRAMGDYLNQENIDALFWYLYSNYAGLNGSIQWFNGKPIIGARYLLWDGFNTPLQLAEKINSLPTDPSDPSSYSVIAVHAWDQSVVSVMETASIFNSNVRVVQANQFVELVNQNLKPELEIFVN